MDVLLTLFGIARAEGTDVEFWLDTPPVATMVLVVGLLGLVALLLAVWRVRGLVWWRWGLLVGVRVILVVLAGTLLFKPSVVLLSPVALKDKVAVLLDSSRSMSVSVRPGEPSRWEKAREALTHGPLAGLTQHYDLDVYTFGTDLAAVSGVESLAAESPSSEETDLTAALEQFTREGRDLSVGALVLLSDGIERGGLRSRWREEGDEGLKKALAPFNLPIHTYPAGAGEDFVDLALEDLKYNEFAFLRQPFKVRVSVRTSNLEGTATLVKLTSGGRLLGSRSIVIPKNGEALPVEFEIDPTRVGKFTYTLESPVLPNEAVAENNRRSFTLKVVRDKTRILQVAGAPSWDVKFLRRLLKSDPNIDLVSFFILRGPSDQSLFPQQDYSLIEFPHEDLFDMNRDLKSFDVVIFQNFGYAPYFREQSERLLASLAEFVRKGGGLAMLGGEMGFAAGGYANTPVEDVLPVRCDLAPSVVAVPAKLQITSQGLRHPVTMLHFDPEVNRQQWNSLPEMDGYNPTSLQPDAVVLATVAGASNLPLLAVRDVGKGRTLALMTDTSWYWSFKAAGEGRGSFSYLRFWKNALRWLVGDPDEGQVQVDSERENYRMGEEAVLQVKVAGADYGPVKDADVEVSIRKDLERSEPVILRGQTSSDGELVLRFKAPEAGPYRVDAVVKGGAVNRGEADTVFTVSEEGPEMKELVGDREFLEALSRVTGGDVLVDKKADDMRLRSAREQTLAQRKVVPLWDRFPTYLLVLALLCSEWGLRRRWGVR